MGWCLYSSDDCCACRLLIEKYGFERTFVITAGIKSLSFLFLVPMLGLVPDGVCRTRRNGALWPVPIVFAGEERLRRPLLGGIAVAAGSDSVPVTEPAEKQGWIESRGELREMRNAST